MSDEGFEIEVGQAVRRHIGRRRSPLADRNRAVTAYDSPGDDPIPVFVSEQVMRAIERHSASDKDHETGGVLLGGFYRNDEGSFVEVTDIVEAENAAGTDISLTFTHETWEYIHEQVARRGGEAQIVGWYHSHPGLGVFMSKQDEFIHSSFFADPWHIAIVHDPIYSNWGCFKWADGKLYRAGGFYVVAEKRRARQLRDYIRTQLANRQAASRSGAGTVGLPDATRAGQPILWAAIAALLVIELALGWAMLSRLPKGNPAPREDHYAAASRLLGVCDLSGAEAELKRELTLHPDNADAARDFRALARALIQPGVANPTFDRQNLVLSIDDELVRSQRPPGSPAGTIKPSVPTQDSRTAPVNADFAGSDPVVTALADYERAAPTRSGRIARARAVHTAAKARWSRETVKWLESEELRQIAYGKLAKPMEYSGRYKTLPTAKKKVVDAIVGEAK